MFVPSRYEVLELITAAVRAPSADNRHHARFAIDDGGLVVRATPFFEHCAEKHRRLLTLLSFGAIGENLRLVLRGHGREYRPQWFPDPADTGLLLDIRWASLSPAETPDPLASYIAARHTNRRFFKGPKLTADEAASLAASMVGVQGAQLEWFDSPPRRRELLRLMRIAETARFGRHALHAEMFESIDFAAGWKRTTSERLSPSTLEVEPFLRIPFAMIRHWSVMRATSLIGADHVLGFRAGDLPARLSPHLGVLTSNLPPDEAALAVGSAFQRLWLAAEGAGLALQPMVASAILATPDVEKVGIGATLRKRLQEGWRELIGEALPLVVFRLGHAPRPRMVSSRRPVEDYLIR